MQFNHVQQLLLPSQQQQLVQQLAIPPLQLSLTLEVGYSTQSVPGYSNLTLAQPYIKKVYLNPQQQHQIAQPQINLITSQIQRNAQQSDSSYPYCKCQDMISTQPKSSCSDLQTAFFKEESPKRDFDDNTKYFLNLEQVRQDQIQNLSLNKTDSSTTESKDFLRFNQTPVQSDIAETNAAKIVDSICKIGDLNSLTQRNQIIDTIPSTKGEKSEKMRLTRMKKYQKQILHQEFQKGHNWSKEQMKVLAKRLDLKVSNVYKWRWMRLNEIKKTQPNLEQDDDNIMLTLSREHSHLSQ